MLRKARRLLKKKSEKTLNKKFQRLLDIQRSLEEDLNQFSEKPVPKKEELKGQISRGRKVKTKKKSEEEKSKEISERKKKEIEEVERLEEIKDEVKPIEKKIKKKALPKKVVKKRGKRIKRKFFKTGIPGFDDLLEKGIPINSAILVAGGAGSGKTIFCLQTLTNAVKNDKKCLYMSFEESEERLREHMRDFGWKVEKFEKKGKLLLKRFSIFEIGKAVDALLTRAKGELLIDVEPLVFPSGFKPDVVIVDSLTAISSSFTGKKEAYRSYIEQLFRLFESMEVTSFLITETRQVPEVFSPTGVEEFLADGVIVLYNIKRENVRERGIEILKLRGAKHREVVVPFKIESDKGIVVYPEQEMFIELEKMGERV